MSDDDDSDFLASPHFRRRMSQYSEARPSTSRTVYGSQAGLSACRTVAGSQARPSASRTVVSAEARPSTSQPTELSQPEMVLLKKLAQKLTDSSVNLDSLKPAAAADKKPVTKEKFKCVFHPCPSSLASISSLLRHYKNVHSVVDPAKFHGCTVDNTIVNLDESLAEHKCIYCGHVARDASALDVHSATSHGTVQNNNLNKSVSNVNTTVVAEVCKDMLKCDECSGYFQDKSKLDDHQKKHHNYEAQCKICNKNFLFKDFDGHVRSTHPEVHGKKEEVIVKKTQRLKSGKVRFIFNCTECSERFFDEDKAKKHGKAHVRGLKTKAVRSDKHVENTDNNSVDPPPESNILFICETCNIATESCDTVVQHSQNHITNPNTKFKSVTCDVCELTFEPACYEKHEDRHYKDKHLCKKTFTVQTYKYHLLFSDSWTAAFNMAAEEVKKLFSQSIYAHTRSIKMRALSVHGETSKLINMYKCGQCNTFVEPASVANHTSNFNTCVKITLKYACTVCAREFINKFARDNHQRMHNGRETIRVVAFNAIRDREFNKVLNDANIMKNHVNQVSVAENNESNDAVIYKCTCGLGFVSKEKSENHLRVCLRNDTIQNCPKCDALFNLSELEDHLKQHSIGGSKFVYKDITIEPIVIDSDDDSENNTRHNDPENHENKNQMAIKVEASHTDSNVLSVPVIMILDSDDEMDLQSNNIEVSTDEQTNKDDASSLPVTTTENQDVCMNESDDQTDLEENERDCDLNNDDDSQGTISCEEPVTGITHDLFNTNDEIKCVPTNQLLSPYYGGVSQTRRVSDEVGVEIESVRRHIEMIEPVTVKQERLRISDPTNYSYIHKRPSLRRNDLPISCTVDLLTDDEDEICLPMNPASVQTQNIDINEDENDDSDTLLTLSGHTATENYDEGLNELPSNTDMAHNNNFDSAENAAVEEIQPENETDVNEDAILTHRNGVELNDLFVLRDQLAANYNMLNNYSDRNSLLENSHTAVMNYAEKPLETIAANNGIEETGQNKQSVVVKQFSSTKNYDSVSKPNQNNAVALVAPDVLINIDNIKREPNESKTKSKLLSASFDVENSNIINVKSEIVDFDRTDDRRSEHRPALDWPTSALRSSRQDDSMVLFPNMQNNERKNRVANYNLNVLVADQNGSIKQSNNNCSIC